MVTTYESIIKYLIEKGEFKKQFLIIDKPFSLKCNLDFERDMVIERYINIDINKKLKYIQKTYHTGQIKAKKPCIRKIEGNTIYFRSSRLFPTLYLDLWILKKHYQNVTIFFDKLFVGYHVLGLDKFYKGEKSTNYMSCLNHWKKRIESPGKKLLSIEKYKSFLEELK